MIAIYSPRTKLVYTFENENYIRDGLELNFTQYWLPRSIFAHFKAEHLWALCGWEGEEKQFTIALTTRYLRKLFHSANKYRYSFRLRLPTASYVVSIGNFAHYLRNFNVTLPPLGTDIVAWLMENHDSYGYDYDPVIATVVVNQLRALSYIRKRVFIDPGVPHITTKTSPELSKQAKNDIQWWVQQVDNRIDLSAPTLPSSKVLPKIEALLSAFKKGRTVTL